MQNWEYTFPPTSKEEWILQVTKDLKGKPIESLAGEWWPGEPLIPLHHSSDAAAEPIILPDNLFAAPPRISEMVNMNGKTAGQINKSMLEALQYGAQDFLLHKTDASPIDVEKLWEGIHLNMIKVIIIDQPGARTLFEETFNKSPFNCFLRFQRNDATIELKEWLASHHNNSALDRNLQFEYDIPSSGNWIEETAKVFQQLLADKKDFERSHFPGSFFEKCILKLKADQDYFKQIVQARVLHLLWLNLQAQQNEDGEKKHRYLECHIKPKDDESPERYLIRASMSSLAAFLSGTAALCIHHSETETTPGYFRRIDRNIHHLLHLESGLPTGSDPLAGAYTIDHYSKSWTERIWKRIHEE